MAEATPQDELLEDGSLVLVLHSALELIPIDEGRFQIRGVNDNVTIEDEGGRARWALCRMDGMTQIGQIVSEISESGEQAALFQLLFNLYRRGLLIKAAGAPVNDLFLAQVDFLRRQTIPPIEQLTNTQLGVSVPDLASCSVGLCGTGNLRNEIVPVLAEYGLPIIDSPRGPDEVRRCAIVVVAADEDKRATFRQHNAELVEIGVPALYVSIGEASIRIGPLVVPQETACFECFHRRTLSLAVHPEEFAAFEMQKQKRVSRPAPLIAARMGACLTVSTLIKYLCGLANQAHLGEVIEMGIMSSRTVHESVLRLPRCNVCGAGHSRVVARSLRSGLVQ